MQYGTAQWILAIALSGVAAAVVNESVVNEPVVNKSAVKETVAKELQCDGKTFGGKLQIKPHEACPFCHNFNLVLIPDVTGRRVLAGPWQSAGQEFEFVSCKSEALGYIDAGHTKYGIVKNVDSTRNYCLGADNQERVTSFFAGDCYSDEPRLASQWWSLTTTEDNGTVVDFLGHSNTTESSGTWSFDIGLRGDGAADRGELVLLGERINNTRSKYPLVLASSVQ